MERCIPHFQPQWKCLPSMEKPVGQHGVQRCLGLQISTEIEDNKRKGIKTIKTSALNPPKAAQVQVVFLEMSMVKIYILAKF